jgi:hypothetical protein
MHAGHSLSIVCVGVGTGVVVGGSFDVVIAWENVPEGDATIVLEGLSRRESVIGADAETLSVIVFVRL